MKESKEKDDEESAATIL